MDLSERNMSQVGEVWLVLRWHTEELQTVEELRGVQEEDKWNRGGREGERGSSFKAATGDGNKVKFISFICQNAINNESVNGIRRDF